MIEREQVIPAHVQERGKQWFDIKKSVSIQNFCHSVSSRVSYFFIFNITTQCDVELFKHILTAESSTDRGTLLMVTFSTFSFGFPIPVENGLSAYTCIFLSLSSKPSVIRVDLLV